MASFKVNLGDYPEKHLSWHEVLKTLCFFGKNLPCYQIGRMLLLLLYVGLVIADVKLLELGQGFLLVLLVKWSRLFGKPEFRRTC